MTNRGTNTSGDRDMARCRKNSYDYSLAGIKLLQLHEQQEKKNIQTLDLVVNKTNKILQFWYLSKKRKNLSSPLEAPDSQSNIYRGNTEAALNNPAFTVFSYRRTKQRSYGRGDALLQPPSVQAN